MGSIQRFFTVSRKIAHHAGSSGYDQLGRYVGSPVRVPPLLYRLRGVGILHRYFRRRSGMEWYDGLYAELVTSLHMRRRDPALYHFLFGERDFRYIPKLRTDRTHKIVATFHATPEEFVKVMIQTEHLKSIDAAIAVSQNQIPMLQQIIGKQKVFFIPHGVDVEHFVPLSETHQSGKTCICVGHHHRDFDTLGKVALIVKERDPHVRFIVVNRVFSSYFSLEEQGRFQHSFSSAGNVELRTGLTDEELLRLYQMSDLMVLPLLDATANVALLEALSCGLPIVATDVGGVRDYIDPDTAALTAVQDSEHMAEEILRLLRNPQERNKLAKASRIQALKFDWRTIANNIKSLYLEIIQSKER